MNEKVPENSSSFPKRYYRVDEVARYFSVSDRTIYRLIETGDIKVIRLRNCLRISVDEFQELEERLIVDF